MPDLPKDAVEKGAVELRRWMLGDEPCGFSPSGLPPEQGEGWIQAIEEASGSEVMAAILQAAAPAIRKQEREQVRRAAEKWANEHRQRAHDLIYKAAPESRGENLAAANTELHLAQGAEKFVAALDTLEDSDG
jgi:acyl-CoA reductase-like NAD-dependent aldehyde dehydrogenase